MTLSDLTSLLPKSNWIGKLQSTLKDLLASLSTTEKELIVKQILAEIATGRLKAGRLIDFIFLGAYIDKQVFLVKIKRAGILRHTRYVESRNPVFTIAEGFLVYRDLYKLTDKEVNYFQSLKNFDFLFQESVEKIKYIKNEIRRFSKIEKAQHPLHRRSAVKTLISFNELNFLIEKEKVVNHDLENIAHYTREEVSEAISFIISQWDELVGLNGYDLHPVNYAWYKSKNFTKLILSACQYLYFREVEIYVEDFGYTVDQVAKKYTLTPPDLDFSKSHEMSLIVSAQQDVTDTIRTRNKYENAPSYAHLSEEFHKAFDESFKRIDLPYPRYVSLTPYPLISKLKEQIMLLEDVVLISSIEKELLIGFGEFQKLLIGKHMTLQDFVTLFRVFLLMHHLNAPKLLAKLDEDEEGVLNSLGAVFKEDKIVEFLSHAGEENVVHEFLDSITWKAGVQNFLDLQYQPVLFMDSYYCVSLNVLSKSRMTRNIFKVESKKGNLLMDRKNADEDMLVESFSYVLRNAGFLVYSDVPVKFKTDSQTQSDIDILALREDIALVIECKDSISTVGPFELRTAYERLVKARDQLTFHLAALRDSKFLETLKKNRGIDLTNVKTLCPVILMSSRQFWGYEFQSFPVRNIHEFSSFIMSGEFSLKLPDEDEEVFNLWSGDELSNSDILKYLSRDGRPHNFFFDSMREYNLKYKEKFNVKHFSLIMNDVQARLRANLKIKPNK